MRISSEAKCRLCRREGHKLFLKGAKCLSAKCPVSTRPYAPGQHGKGGGFKKISNFGRQLRFKQETKRIYGLNEAQLQKYYEAASRMKGSTGDYLVTMLEMRLDSILYRSGAVDSPALARQISSHGHVVVNDHIIKTPSRILQPGDKFAIKPGSQKKKLFTERQAVKVQLPSWLKFDMKTLSGEIVSLPTKEDLEKVNVQSKAIVEFYSR
ncbi:MAG: hypothetical protein A2V81_04095 [Candidatus Abawacabacteria bacterium RBG_16_42_10]|uniref:Small ribosomal subunit protein uS4 n=1 Tax=Candidatus Abawacabacteria bacterium RBG_16_42_10 TaxID=1817814 RepID=A0A1F4XIG8_9BACT|nr:MAG: hypothetical protein A2V81_04095 [Candidatus Abawacabacteria bacterium RBG_16_42_10]